MKFSCSTLTAVVFTALPFSVSARRGRSKGKSMVVEEPTVRVHVNTFILKLPIANYVTPHILLRIFNFNNGKSANVH